MSEPGITFEMTLHMGGDKCHSSRYTCKLFGIGMEVHVFGSSHYGIFEPSEKKQPETWYYEEDKPGKFHTLKELLDVRPELKARIDEWKAKQPWGKLKPAARKEAPSCK
jgi:hypothetical protein